MSANRKLEDVVKSLTESIVFEYAQNGFDVDLASVRSACTAALRRALPAELEQQRAGAVRNLPAYKAAREAFYNE